MNQEKIIKILRTNVRVFNRWRKIYNNSVDLQGADLQWANLRWANLDFSCLSLSYKSLLMNTDEKIRVQIAFHWASLVKHTETATDEEKALYNAMLNYVNRFHRTMNDVNVLPILK